jgi:hypothetical protein
MAGVALLAEVDHVCDGGCDTHHEGRSGTIWSKASTAATATGLAARQSADAAKGHLEVVCPIVREKASKAAIVAGTAARHGMEVATEGLDAVKQSCSAELAAARQSADAAKGHLEVVCPMMREKVSTAAVAAGSVARHHVEVAKDQLDTVRQSKSAKRGKASAKAAGVVAKQRLVVAKGHLDSQLDTVFGHLDTQLDTVRHSGPVIAARQGVDAAKERVDAAKDFLASVRYPGLVPGQSVNAADPGQDVDDSARLIATAFARHHLVGMEADDSEAAAEFLRSQRKPPTVAGAARLRVKASFKKARSTLRTTKRRMTSFIKKTGLNKQSQKQRAAQRAAATESISQRFVQSHPLDPQTTEPEDDVAPPDVFELFSSEELALQQALTESAESAEWGATPDGRQPTPVDFFPVETAPAVPVETASTVSEETAFAVPVETASTDPVRSDVLAPDAGEEHLVNRAWFLQPSAGTWLLPLPYSLQDVSSTPLLDNVAEEVSSSEAVSSPEVLTSKISTPTCANLVQLRSCGGA